MQTEQEQTMTYLACEVDSWRKQLDVRTATALPDWVLQRQGRSATARWHRRPECELVFRFLAAPFVAFALCALSMPSLAQSDLGGQVLRGLLKGAMKNNAGAAPSPNAAPA